ncbi:MAG: DUF4332 domain-containing protein [Gammaproteobacteria bacterium]|nr:DUF4332 domain-containing protein [Gammaproteobacteria bacterium]
MAQIESIEGIGPSFGEKLREIGIETTKQLLSAGATPSGRKDIVNKTGISACNILKWVNMADLFRINGVAGQFSEILEAAGVDTVKELRNRNVENLYQKISEVNDEKKLVRQIPNEKKVTDWVQQAKSLPPFVTY